MKPCLLLSPPYYVSTLDIMKMIGVPGCHGWSSPQSVVAQCWQWWKQYLVWH